MDRRYLQMAQCIEPLLTLPQSTDHVGQKLREQINAAPWAIDFDQVADVYNSYYWVRNFWKAAYFFNYEYSLTPTATRRLATHQHLDVTFIGCGAGSDVLAFLTWYTTQFPLTELRLTLIDSSRRQLDTLAEFVRKTAHLVNGITVKTVYVYQEADQWAPHADTTDVLLFGHFLVENPDKVHSLILKSSVALRSGGDVIILERPNDNVLLHARQVLANAGLTVYDTTTNEDHMALIRKNLTNLGTTGISSHYLRATIPDVKIKAEIISNYFLAWREQIIEPIKEIFTADARFEYRPGFRPAVDGLAAIQEYWRQKPLRQSDVKVLIRNVSYSENVSVCAFEGDFDTPSEHVVIRGALCFSIDGYTQKIKKLTGHYGAVKTPV